MGTTPVIGKTLSHFRILAKIGEGGMGVVYRAEDVRLRRPVAIKVLPPDLVGDAERRLRFVREARAAAAVSHPNIATIHEVDEENGVVFIAMEYLEGCTLRSLIIDKPLPTKEVLRIAVAVAEGLARAHQARVIHRDLKPENVFVTSDQQVKILDFGLAKPLEKSEEAPPAPASRMETISAETSRAGKIVGTAAYMSPEQARGEVVDPRSDLFSFGILLYELVTGVRPFRGRTTTDTLTAILRDEPTPPGQINSDVSPDLERIIEKCLAKDRQERYQHADEVAVDLRRLRRSIDSGVQAIGMPSPGRAAEASGAWRRLIGTRLRRLGIIGVLAAALVGAGVSLWWARYDPGKFRSGARVIVADFEDTSGLSQFDTAIRDALENMLSLSPFLQVIRGDGLKELLRVSGKGEATGISREIADRSCAGGRCEGFLAGRVEREGSGYRLEAALYRAGKVRPAVVRSAVAPSEGDILMVLHRMVLDIRRGLGEAPQALAAVAPPTTKSLQAYQAFSISSGVDDPDERVGLLRKAVEQDPDFVGAYSELANQCWNSDRCQEYKQFAQEAYNRSSGLPERDRLFNEINYLEASYEYDTEIERLKRFQLLYPLDSTAANALASLYDRQEDLISTETYARAAYNLSADEGSLSYLIGSLRLGGKADEIERLVSDFRSRGGSEEAAAGSLLWVYRLRGDRERLEQTIRLLERKPGSRRAGAMASRVETFLAAGQLIRARDALASYWRGTQESHPAPWRHAAARCQLWLDARAGARQFRFSPEEIELAKNCLWYLPQIAVFQVDLGSTGPLPDLIKSHEQSERGSKSRFVQEELQFARGCLLLIRGDAAAARQSLEPLARNSNLSRRHRILGRDYEALKEWDAAAKEYEETLRNPYMKWVSDNPALWVLDQFRLARIYEHLGNADGARRWYGRFLVDWKEADSDIPEVADARKRLVALGGTQPPGD